MQDVRHLAAERGKPAIFRPLRVAMQEHQRIVLVGSQQALPPPR